MLLWIVGEVTPSHMGKPRSQIFSYPSCPLRQQPLIHFFDTDATPIYRGFDELENALEYCFNPTSSLGSPLTNITDSLDVAFVILELSINSVTL